MIKNKYLIIRSDKKISNAIYFLEKNLHREFYLLLMKKIIILEL